VVFLKNKYEYPPSASFALFLDVFFSFLLSLQDRKLQSTCYSMLLTLASQHFTDCNLNKCVSVLTAALQYAPQKSKSQTAQLLAATHLRLHSTKKALEYMDIATRNRGGGDTSSLGVLVEMGAASFPVNTALVRKGKTLSFFALFSGTTAKGG
jgi:hypothetical protein